MSVEEDDTTGHGVYDDVTCGTINFATWIVSKHVCRRGVTPLDMMSKRTCCGATVSSKRMWISFNCPKTYIKEHEATRALRSRTWFPQHSWQWPDRQSLLNAAWGWGEGWGVKRLVWVEQLPAMRGNHVWLCNALVASCSLMYVLGQLKLIHILLDDTGTTHHVLLDIIFRGVTPLRQTCFDTIQVAKFTVPHITSS